MVRLSIRRALCLSITFAAAGTPARAQQKSPITPKDYGKWEQLGLATLSPDGRWLAYGVARVNEENELRLRGGANDTTIVVTYAGGAAFTPDSRWVAWSVGVSPAQRDKLEKDKKPIRNSLGARNLATGEAIAASEIVNFRFSPDGKFLAMRGYPAEGKRAATLFVHDLAHGTRTTFGNISEFAWADDGALLALTVETDNATGNAIQVYDASNGATRVLESSNAIYRAIAWRKKSDDVAALRTISDKGFRDTTHALLAFRGVRSSAPVRSELNPTSNSRVPSTMRIADARRPEWAKDGKNIYFGMRPRDPAFVKPDSVAEKISDVQVWHGKDVRIMPMQKVQEQQDLGRTLLTAWRVASDTIVPLGTDLLETVRVLEGGKYATETDTKPYAFGEMFGRHFQDIWLVDVQTGTRRKALEKVRYFAGASPTGDKLLWYDGKNWWTQRVATGARTNLTANVKATFADPDWDYPTDFAPSEGFAGWTKGDGAVLVYDTYDIWSLKPDGSGGTRLTDGAAEQLQHRVANVSPSPDGIDTGKPLYLSLTGRRSKKTGYAKLTVGSAPQHLILNDERVIGLARADSADVFLFRREKFDVSPNWYVAGADLTNAKARSATNTFQQGYAWGRSELVNFKSRKGLALQAGLYYPANYDPSKKYPMIVYTYELLSQNVHTYAVPSERNYYNVAVFTANGYFVLQPDIVFRGRDPGISALDAVEPAVASIIARGMVDAKRVGHVGHSWGGYEAAFFPTRTKTFAASVAGAPITNFLSFAGAIHWTPGIAEFDHWETGQARMGVAPWEDLAAYLRNSPIAKVQDLTTPLLMEAGDADGTVDWHQSIEFYNHARRAGKTNFVMLMYPGEDHGLRKKENQIDYSRRILQWFGHWLKGEPAPSWITDGTPWLERKAALEANK